MIELNKIKKALLVTVALVSSTTAQAMMDNDRDVAPAAPARPVLASLQDIKEAQESINSTLKAMSVSKKVIRAFKDTLTKVVKKTERLNKSDLEDFSFLVNTMGQNVDVFFPEGSVGYYYKKVIARWLGKSRKKIARFADLLSTNKNFLFPECMSGDDRAFFISSTKLDPKEGMGKFLEVVYGSKKVTHEEIQSRAQAFTLFVTPLLPKVITNEDVEQRLKIMGTCLIIPTAEIQSRVQLLSKYKDIFLPSNMSANDCFQHTAQILDMCCDEIESCAQKIIDNRSLSPEEFSSRWQAIIEYKDILLPEGITLEIPIGVINKAFELCAEEIKRRMEAIIVFAEYLRLDPKVPDTYAQIILTALGMSAEEIKLRTQAIKDNKDILFHGYDREQHTKVALIALGLSAEDIKLRARAIKDNEDTLLRGYDRERFTKAVLIALGLSVEDINLRVQAIKKWGIPFLDFLDLHKFTVQLFELEAEEIKARAQAIEARKNVLFPTNVYAFPPEGLLSEAFSLSAEEIRKSYLVKKDSEWRLETPPVDKVEQTPKATEEGDRPDAKLFNPPSFPSSAPMAYEDYFREEFLPKMGDSCRAYNGFKKTNEEILAILFPDLPKGTYPDRERATQKFAALAAGGRPYTKLFNPPSGL